MIINPFEDLMPLEEAAEKWDVDPMDIMEKIANEDLIKDVDIKKFNKQWLVTKQAMDRIFGSLEEDPSGLIMANMPYASSRYEAYVRNAFGVARSGDPAQLALDEVLDIAEADPSYLSKARAAASYGGYIYNSLIDQDYKGLLEDQEATILDLMVQSIAQAQDKLELFEALDRHYSLVENIMNRG